MESLSFPEHIPAERGFVHFFGTRQSPAPLINTVRVGQVTAVPPDYPCVISLKQVHGTDVLVCENPDDLKTVHGLEGDALVTSCSDVLLVVRTADCVPVLMADVERNAVAAVHAGWRGTVAGIVRQTIRVMTEQYGTEPSNLRVAIGPSIGMCCFEVDRPVIDPIKEQWADACEVLKPTSPTHAMVDLKKLIGYQLIEAGVSAASISQSTHCTNCDATRYFSYRREGRVNGTMNSGIMMRAH
ncbi:MAG: peptidoglycan editing factor PgeF [Nitrospirales bacterium]|nr:peptidoglycan editing factor PgeF [Nitrospira sp.]MDR4500459.1 peptidoglycan editing factor PgeF [Nitrospirales bacterium]